MALEDDGRLVDSRTPVTISDINQETIGSLTNELKDAGSRVDVSASPDGIGDEFTQRAKIEYLLDIAWYSESEARQKRNLLRTTEGSLSVEEGGKITVEMRYNQPNISVSSSGRFQEHQTIGGPVIRQKIGEGNVEVEMEGVCTTPEANLIDALRFEDTVTVLSNRYSGFVQIASASTSPLEDGGAMNLDGEFTHSYSITFVQVE